MSAPVSVVETVSARGGMVWRIRCGGCYVGVDGRLIEMGTQTVTTETVDALIAALRIAADMAGSTVSSTAPTSADAGLPGQAGTLGRCRGRYGRVAGRGRDASRRPEMI